MNKKALFSLCALAAFGAANAQFLVNEGNDTLIPAVTADIETEMRSGNYANNGDWEVGTGPREANNSPVTEAQYAWSPNGQSFKLTYDGLTGIADLMINGSSVVSNTTNPGFLTSDLFIRIRATGDRVARIDNLTVDGVLIGDYNETAQGDAKVIHINYIGFADSYTVEGDLLFEGGSGSNPAVQIKQLGQPVPEPATMLALGAGVAALVARRRRKA